MASSQPTGAALPAAFLALPNTVLLLVHLHLLSCPFTNNPDCDEFIFDQHRRGGGQRTKYMEEIVFFLIGKIEGDARSILPMYPCLDKGDTVAFRNAAIKYMENIRTSAIRSTAQGPPPPQTKASSSKQPPHTPSSSSKSSSKLTSKPPLPSQKPSKSSGVKSATSSLNSPIFGWWWKDILPRSSVLQECSGDRFERLLLALSVHALFKLASQLGSSKYEGLADTSLASFHAFLAQQPKGYMSLLQQALSMGKRTQLQSDAMSQRYQQLAALRSGLNQPTNGAVPPPLPQLRLTRDSRFAELIDDTHGPWRGEKGKDSLDFLIDFIGIRAQSTTAVSSMVSVDDKPLDEDDQPEYKGPVPPLPTAAAHHPLRLKDISRLPSTMFRVPESTDAALPTDKAARSAMFDAMIGQMGDTSQQLEAALAQAKNAEALLAKEYKAALAARPQPSGPPLDLWREPPLELESIPPASMFHVDPPISIEARMERIRASIEVQLTEETTPLAPAPPKVSRLPTFSKSQRADRAPTAPIPQIDLLEHPSPFSPPLPDTFSPVRPETPPEEPQTPPASARKKPKGPRTITKTPKPGSTSARKRVSILARPANTSSLLASQRRKKSSVAGALFQRHGPKTPRRISTVLDLETPRRDSIDVAADEIVASVKREVILTTPPTVKGRRLLDSNNKPVSIKRSPAKLGTSARTLFEEAAGRRSPSFSGALDAFDIDLPTIDFDTARKYSIVSGLTRQSGVGVVSGGGSRRRTSLLPRNQLAKSLTMAVQPIKVLEEEVEDDESLSDDMDMDVMGDAFTGGEVVGDWVDEDAVVDEEDDFFEEGPSLTLRDILLRASSSSRSGADDSLRFNFDMIQEEESPDIDQTFGWD